MLSDSVEESLRQRLSKISLAPIQIDRGRPAQARMRPIEDGDLSKKLQLIQSRWTTIEWFLKSTLVFTSRAPFSLNGDSFKSV